MAIMYIINVIATTVGECIALWGEPNQRVW